MNYGPSSRTRDSTQTREGAQESQSRKCNREEVRVVTGAGGLRLTVMAGDYAVCRLPADAPLPSWALTGAFYSVTRTMQELSVVVMETSVPPDVAAERGWAILQVAGPLDFALTGVLASLIAPLAQAAIPVFVLSTYDTDYLLVKRAQLDAACALLRAAGHGVA